MTKTCAHCLQPIPRGENYSKKKYCGRACYVASMKDTQDRALAKFWSNVDKNGPGGCWLWTSYRNERGYGLMSVQGNKNMRAHRFSWELVNGPTPSEKFCLHKCDVRHCVNPEHLFLGSYLENARDSKSKRRHVFGERVHTAVLTEADVLEIRRSYKVEWTGRRLRGNGDELAARYGVRPGTIKSIVARRLWKHVA